MDFQIVARAAGEANRLCAELDKSQKDFEAQMVLKRRRVVECIDVLKKQGFTMSTIEAAVPGGKSMWDHWKHLLTEETKPHESPASNDLDRQKANETLNLATNHSQTYRPAPRWL